MKVVIQRVKSAKVKVKGKDVTKIGSGLLLLVGIGKDDTMGDVERLSKKVVNMRIFEDEHGKMNLNLKQLKAQVLSVPQFTLYADTRKGNRPGFDLAAAPEKAKKYWRNFNALLKASGIDTKEGIFGARMEVELINDGPVTICLDN